MVSSNASENIQKNKLLFQYKLVKQLRTYSSLLIALDLSGPPYEVLLITYMEFAKKKVQDVRKEKSNQYAILLGLKIIN